jgi:hypothetical protein
MTRKEMNEFLKSIGGLVNGYYPDRDPISDSHMFCVGEGWFDIIKDLITDLIELGWDRKVLQVKEKFGGLRFYIPLETDEMSERILEAEDKSYHTCEVTGKEGKIRLDLGWYRTLCDEEYQKVRR